MTRFNLTFCAFMLTTSLGAGAPAAVFAAPDRSDAGTPVRGEVPAGQTPADQTPSDQSEADIFDTSTFDETVQKSRNEEKKEALSYLVGGTLLMDATMTVPAVLDGYTAAGSFAGKAFAKASIPSYGQLYLGYNLQHTLLQGAGGSLSASPLGSGLFSNSFALSEFFFDFDIAKRLFVRVGNQLLAWGPSNVWTPVDFVNLQKASTLQPIDLRIGKPGIKLFLPLRRFDFTLFSDFSESVESGVVGDLGQTTKIAFRSASTIGGFELGLSGYFGQRVQGRYGFDLSGSLLGAVVYGELAMLFPYGGYDLAYSATVGLSRSFGELKRWNAQAEFFYNSRGTDAISEYPALLASGGFIPLYLGKLYGYAAMTKQELFAPYLDLTLSAIANLSDRSYQAKIAAKLSIPGFLPFTASVAYGGGGSGREFTYFAGNDSLALDLQALLQF